MTRRKDSFSSKTTTTTTKATTTPSLSALSLGWLALCTGLVLKHVELLTVFLAFFTCFAVAAFLSWWWRTKNDNNKNNMEDPTHHHRIRHAIGVGMHTLALAYLAVTPRSPESSTHENYNRDEPNEPTLLGNNNNNNNGGLTTTMMMMTWTLISSCSAEFVALSLAAGTLAFDHWHAALTTTTTTGAATTALSISWHRVGEQACTLSAILILLVLVDTDVLARYRNAIAAALVYQIARFVTMVAAWPNETSVRTTATTTTTTTATPIKRKNASKLLVTHQHHHHNHQQQKEQQRNVDPTRLWKFQGQWYDLRPFVERHPGGREALLLGQGRQDCTALVVSYHPFAMAHVQATLAKYRVDNIVDNQKAGSKVAVATTTAAVTPPPPPPTTPSHHDDAFYAILCQRVEQTLLQQGFDPQKNRAANGTRVLYYVAIATGVLVSGYQHLQSNPWGSLGFALTGWFIGALGHDAGHFATSRYPWINDLGVWGMSLLCNPMLWQHQHTYAHHSFTNEFDHDPDLHHFHTLLRVHKKFQHAQIYQNQRYLPFIVLAYALVVFGECVWIPVGMLREGTLYGLVEWTDRKRPCRAIAMVTHLVFYVGLVLIAPFCAAPWYQSLGCVVLHVAVSGLLFGFFSQINHLNEASIETAASGPCHPLTKTSWAARQVETSNNFCPHSALWYYLSNGLNLQIEHHLFPGLNHCHLWRIAPIVQATCQEYGVSYKAWDTWSDLWAATRQWLNKLANDESLKSID